MRISDLTYITHLLEFIAALLAFIHFKKFKNSKERYFLHFLWFTFGVDLIGDILADFYEVQTYPIYNLYMLVSFLFYFYWYYLILKRIDLRKIILVFVALFVCAFLLNFILQGWQIYHKYSFMTGSLLTLVCTVFHFWQLLNSDEILEIKYKLSFWISTGLLLFNIGIIPIVLLSDHFSFSEIQYYILIITLNFILYGCYSIGFLWTKEKYNRS